MWWRMKAGKLFHCSDLGGCWVNDHLFDWTALLELEEGSLLAFQTDPKKGNRSQVSGCLTSLLLAFPYLSLMCCSGCLMQQLWLSGREKLLLQFVDLD